MSNTFEEFKNYLQFLTPLEQIAEISHMIHDTLLLNNPDDINKKYHVIKELNIIKKQLLHAHDENNIY